MIELSHLSKQFGSLIAVDDLNLTLVPGEILGFLGPNGAGKSTTMKMIAGFLAPSSGDVKVHGHSIKQDPIACQQLIGYLPEGAPCYDEMTPEGFLDFIAEIRGYSGQEKLERVGEAIAKTSLQSVLGQRIETLSKGFKRRVGLAQAILHDPKVLILDEPTDGLDPNQKHQVRAMIRGLSKDKIVIISTHILEEVTAVCSRVIIIADGALQADCTPSELERRSKYHGAITVNTKVGSGELDKLSEKLMAMADVKTVEIFGAGLTVFPESGVGSLYASVSQCLAETGIEAENLFQERGRLDDVFRQVTLGGAS